MARKKWYYQGKLLISKCDSEINYRSGWEKEVALLFEEDKTIEKIEYETLRIPYVSNKKRKKIKIYLPDFVVHFIDGTKKIIEIKRDDRVKTKIVEIKALAAKQYIEKNLKNTIYEIWTKKEIDNYRKLLGVSPKKKTEFKKQRRPVEKKKIVKTDKPTEDRQELLLRLYKKCSKKKK